MFEIKRFCKFLTKFQIARPAFESVTPAPTILSEEMIPCKCCQVNKYTTKYKRKIFSVTGMPRVVAVLLWALFLTSLLSRAVSARGIPGSPSIEESQDLYRLLDTIQERDPKSLTYLKELALLLDKSQSLDLSQQSEELLPVPLAIQGRPLPGMQEGPREEKRGSYVSLCHFKICNMGRKRGYFNPWNRT